MHMRVHISHGVVLTPFRDATHAGRGGGGGGGARWRPRVHLIFIGIGVYIDIHIRIYRYVYIYISRKLDRYLRLYRSNFLEVNP